MIRYARLWSASHAWRSPARGPAVCLTALLVASTVGVASTARA
jgi:hypothetical protein